MKKALAVLILITLAVLALSACLGLETYTVSFELNGGTGECKDVTVFYGKRYGKLPIPLRTGYSFEGWAIEAQEGEPVIVDRFSVVDVAENHTLVATWKLLEFDISFNTNGGSEVESQTVIYGEKVDSPALPVREGYIFRGWYKDASLSTDIDFDQDSVYSDMIVYAKWEMIMPEIIRVEYGEFDDENSIFISCPQEALYINIYDMIEISSGATLFITDSEDEEAEEIPQEFELVNPTYTFFAYVTSPDKNYVAEYVIIIHKSFLTQVIFHIKDPIEAENYYLFDEYSINTITGITFIATQSVIPTGYTFEGWLVFDGEDYVEFTEVKRLLAELNLYAKLTPIEYIINYQLDEGENSENNPESYTIRDKIVLEEATKEGYIFMGWYLDEQLERLVNIIELSYGELELFAKWEPDPAYEE